VTNRRRRVRPQSNHDRWLVSYADFITLLFAFFVVLYSSAQVDHRKIGRLAIAIQAAFQELGVFPASGQIPLRGDDPAPLNSLVALEKIQQTAAVVSKPSTTPVDPNVYDEATLALLQEELQQALQNEIAAHTVALHREAEGLVLSLREFGFFDSGSSSLKPSALPALDRIASVLTLRTCRLRIEGHTDNVPIHTPHVATNWELSTARASELVRLLILRYGFSPDRLAAAGYAQYHPIASNATAQGRAQNRRVDVVILSGHSISEPRMESADPSKPSAAIP
jgi:chemotaxis protein MotB